MNIIGMLEVFETSTGESEWIQKQVHTPTEEYCAESSHSIVCMAFTVLNIQSDRDQRDGVAARMSLKHTQVESEITLIHCPCTSPLVSTPASASAVLT